MSTKKITVNYSAVACVVLLLAICHPPASAQSEDTHGLLLRGKILNIRTDRSHKGYVDLLLDLSLDFSNDGSAPVIMMRPWYEQDYWHGGSLIATTLQNAQTHKYLFADGMWESISGSDSYRRLARALDQPRPPERLTMILKPGMSWNWRTSVMIRFEENTHWRYPRLATWEEMKTQTSPLWLRVSFEMWPFNAEHFKPNLASKLQKRWRKFAYLWIGEKHGRMHLARLLTEPIELDWNAALSLKSRTVGLDTVSKGSGSDLVKRSVSRIVWKYRMLIADQVATAPCTDCLQD